MVRRSDKWGTDGDLERDAEVDSAERRVQSSPGKVARSTRVYASVMPGSLVQLLAAAVLDLGDDEVHRRAEEGIAGGGGRLPYYEEIQRAFGRHDVGGVRAHVGGTAAKAASAIGARAYATGDDVAFAGTPDLRTTAHEAAHVVQQRSGVQLLGGVGSVGDRYERHADAVADAVVRGESAEALLDQMAPGGGVGRAVQRDPQRGDEARVTPEGERPTHILRGSTHRFGALMYIYESGDFGSSGRLGPNTVVGANGETLEQLYHMYRRGEIASENNHFRPEHAAGLVQSFRDNGFVTDPAEAERLGIGGRDGVHPIRVVPVEPGQDPGPPIDQRLEGDGLRAFVVDGYQPGTRATRQARFAREDFERGLEHDGNGNWTRDGQPLDESESARLREHLGNEAERRAVLRGEMNERYRRYLADRNNPPIEPEAWYRAHGQEHEGGASGSGANSGSSTDGGATNAAPGTASGGRPAAGSSWVAADEQELQRTLASYPETDLPDDTPVYRYTLAEDGGIDSRGRTFWQTEPNVAHGGVNSHLFRTTLGQLRRSGTVRSDPHELNQGGGSGSSIVVFHNPGTSSLPATEVDSGIIGQNPRSGQIIYRYGHPHYSEPEGAWVDRAGQMHFPDEEPGGPPFEAWRGGSDITAPVDAHSDGDRFHGAIGRGDYAGAVGQVMDSRDDGEEGGGGTPRRPPDGGDASDTSPEPSPSPRRTSPQPQPEPEPEPEPTTPRRTSPQPEPEPEPTTPRRTSPRRPPGRTSPPQPEPEPTRQRAPQPAVERGGTRAQILREELQWRELHGDEESRARARRGLDILDNAGPDPSDEAVDNAAQEGRVDIYRLAPRAPSTQGRLGHDGTVEIERNRSDGSQRSASGRVDQHGGQGEVAWNPTGRDRDQRRVGASYEEQRGGDGEVVGRDVGVSAGRGPISGELSGGYTFDVQPAAEQPDGSFQVAWTVSLRGGGGASGSAGGRGGGGRGRGTVTRSGTHVATGGTREENRAAAERYRQDFRNHAIREFQRAAGRELGTVDWWRRQPAGTARRVAVGGTLSASASAAIFNTLSLGANGDITVADEAEVTRGEGNTVTVTQTWEVSGGGSATGGFLVSTGYGHEGRRRVRETFAVDLETGEAAFAAFLSHDSPLEQGQEGVRLRSRREDTSHRSRMNAGLVGVGQLQGGEGTGEIREQQFDDEGNVVDTTVTETGRQTFEGGTVTGDYARRNFEVQAPQTDEDYTITTDLHGTEGEESASMLGRATGEGRAGSRARSSGNWIVGQRVTQEEALRFHRRLIAGDPPGPGSPLRGVYSDLRSVPTNDDELIARADDEAAQRQLRAQRRSRGAAISEFLSEEGDRGLTLLRSVAGGADDTRYLRLFHEGEEDLTAVGNRSADEIEAGEDNRRRIPTFLGRSRSREMEQWIAARQESPISPEDVNEARSRITDLDARIAQIADVNNYTDLPPDTRSAVLARYRGYRRQLAAIVQRAGDSVASEMSSEGQDHHASLRALQQRVAEAQRAADRHRDAVIGYRRRYGQMGSEYQQHQLPSNVASRTGAQWSMAETAYQGAEDARQSAERRLGQSVGSEEGRGEHQQRAAYRSAEADLERAQHSYETAREEMRRLQRVYQRYEAYRHGGEAGLHDERRRQQEADAAERQRADADREQQADADGGDEGAGGETRAPDVRITLPSIPFYPYLRTSGRAGQSLLIRRGSVQLSQQLGNMVVRIVGAESLDLSDEARERLRRAGASEGMAYLGRFQIVTPHQTAETIQFHGSNAVVQNRRGAPFRAVLYR